MALKRTSPYWQQSEYHNFLHQSAGKPFVWGTWDCALFAADGIQSFTGVDIASDFRNKYTTEASALATIKAVTGMGTTVADAAAYCAQKYGLVELQHPLTAQRGDLVIVDRGDGVLIAGLVHLSGHIVCAGEKSLMRLPITSVKRAWRV